MRQDLWKWFQFTGRSLSRSHLTPDTLFDSALMFYRNAKIQDFEKRLLDDQSILEDIVTDVNSVDNNEDRIAIASDTAYEVLSGSRFVSLNKIPDHILQKPLSVRQRNPDDKYRVNAWKKNYVNFTFNVSRLKLKLSMTYFGQLIRKES